MKRKLPGCGSCCPGGLMPAHIATLRRPLRDGKSTKINLNASLTWLYSKLSLVSEGACQGREPWAVSLATQPKNGAAILNAHIINPSKVLITKSIFTALI
jgi:hypothetical protein